MGKGIRSGPYTSDPSRERSPVYSETIWENSETFRSFIQKQYYLLNPNKVWSIKKGGEQSRYPHRRTEKWHPSTTTKTFIWGVFIFQKESSDGEDLQSVRVGSGVNRRSSSNFTGNLQGRSNIEVPKTRSLYLDTLRLKRNERFKTPSPNCALKPRHYPGSLFNKSQTSRK